MVANFRAVIDKVLPESDVFSASTGPSGIELVKNNSGRDSYLQRTVASRCFKNVDFPPKVDTEEKIIIQSNRR